MISTTTPADELMAFVQPGQLQARLAALPLAATMMNVAVGFSYEGRHETAACGKQVVHGADAVERLTPVGCVAKLLTAALVRRGIADGMISLDSNIAAFLAVQGIGSSLANITIRHLLNHTHGLDDSTVWRLTFERDGFIDARALLKALCAAAPIAAPGRLYSYGSAGAWLCATILESVYGLSYRDLLTRILLAPLGIEMQELRDPAKSVPSYVCAAAGGTLALSVNDLMRLIVAQLSDSDELLSPAQVQELPGWHSTERGICFGWKYYGDGWFGHNSESTGAALFARVNARRRIGLLIASGSQPPSAIASALFRRHLPGLVRLEVPQLLKGESIELEEIRCATGVYANDELSVRIAPRGANSLEIHVASRSAPARVSASLRRAENGCFFLQPPPVQLFPFVQFVDAAPAGYRYLWTGKWVLPRQT